VRPVGGGRRCRDRDVERHAVSRPEQHLDRAREGLAADPMTPNEHPVAAAGVAQNPRAAIGRLDAQVHARDPRIVNNDVAGTVPAYRDHGAAAPPEFACPYSDDITGMAGAPRPTLVRHVRTISWILSPGGADDRAADLLQEPLIPRRALTQKYRNSAEIST
jgi:hypothetical protein